MFNIDLHHALGIGRKKKNIWLIPLTKNPIPTENSKTNGQHKNATKNVDYTTIADRLRTAETTLKQTLQTKKLLS